MPVDRKRILAFALQGLVEERSRIDAEIAELQAQLRGGEPQARAAARPAVRRRKAKPVEKKAKRGRKAASAMKLLWEKARKAGFSNLKDYKASLGQQL
ncbi:MAG: hypothetical protein DKINENOH_04372 [bacterium]|nr:hypothetical protein [bacterium]